MLLVNTANAVFSSCKPAAASAVSPSMSLTTASISANLAKAYFELSAATPWYAHESPAKTHLA